MSTHTVYIGSKPRLLALAWVEAKSGKYKSYRCLLMNVDQTDCAGSISMCSSCLFCGVNWLLALQLIIIGNRRPLTVNFKHGDALLHSRMHSADAFIQSGLRIHKDLQQRLKLRVLFPCSRNERHGPQEEGRDHGSPEEDAPVQNQDPRHEVPAAVRRPQGTVGNCN